MSNSIMQWLYSQDDTGADEFFDVNSTFKNFLSADNVLYECSNVKYVIANNELSVKKVD